MKKQTALRIAAAAMAATCALTFTGCGKSLIQGVTGLDQAGTGQQNETTDGDNTQTAQGATVDPNGRYFKTEYQTVDLGVENLNENSFQGDKFIYSGYDKEFTTMTVAMLDMITGEKKTLYNLSDMQDDIDNPEAEHSSISSFYVDEEGNFYMYANTWNRVVGDTKLDFPKATDADCIDWLVNNWGYAESDAVNVLEDYKKQDEYKDDKGNFSPARLLKQLTIYGLPQNSRTELLKQDKDGKETLKIVLSEQKGDEEVTSNTWCQTFKVDDNGNIYLLINTYSWGENEEYSEEYRIDIYSPDGKKEGSVKAEPGQYISELIIRDGKVGYGMWGDNGYDLHLIDPKTFKESETITLGNNFNGNEDVEYDATHVLRGNGSGLDLVEKNTDNKEKFLKWLDCDIPSSDVNSYSKLSDGSLAVVTSHWDNKTNKNNVEVIKLTEIPYTEVVPKIELKYAAAYLDYDFEKQILDYNRHSNDYRITVEQFEWTDEITDYEVAMKEYFAKMVTDKTVDFLCFDGNTYQNLVNFAKKGLLIDLTDSLAEAGLPKDIFIPSINEALTVDGKLVGVANSVVASTVVGKESVVGKVDGINPGWDVDQMLKVLKSQPKGTKLFGDKSKNDILNIMLNVGYLDFIDRNSSKCNFDNDQFKAILRLAKDFPDEIDWDKIYENGDGINSQLKSGEVMLSEVYLYDKQSLQAKEVILGEPISCIGYPSASGNGALLNLNNVFAITKNCEAPAEVIKAIKGQFDRMYSDDGKKNNTDRYINGMPSQIDDFDAYLKYLTKDHTGEEGYYDGMEDIWIDDMTEPIKAGPLTQAQADVIKNLYYNAKGIVGAMSSDVMAIIQEEAGAYFSGQKTEDEVASIVQSRVQIYLSETE